jgi:hypothetical protein
MINIEQGSGSGKLTSMASAKPVINFVKSQDMTPLS